MTRSIARDLGAAPDDLRARLAAASILAAFETALERLEANPDQPVTDEEAMQVLDQGARVPARRARGAPARIAAPASGAASIRPETRGYSDVDVKMGSTTEKLRIGSFAELAGTTPRTIRYYEEIGLLPCPSQRGQGQHRCYTEADVDRVREIVRLRDLLGVSLEQLARLLAAHDPHAELLALIRARRRQLGALERELTAQDPAA